MAGARWTNRGEVHRKIKANVNKSVEDVKQVVAEAAAETSDAILTRGRADIAGAGRFGSRWQNALQAPVVSSGNTTTIDVAMVPQGPPVIYWKIFEYGATITPKTVSNLAIPFDPDNTTWPRNYQGKLFRKGRGLFDAQTKEAKYFLTPSVTIPQKFHLRDIVKQVAQELRQHLQSKLRRR